MQKEIEDILLDKVIDGDEAACRLLLDRYKHLVYTLVYRMLKNAEDAEEVTQDVFVKAFRSLEGFRRDAKFSTWLYRIAWNTASSRLRKKKPAETDLETVPEGRVSVDAVESSFQKMRRNEQRRYIAKALAVLPADDASLVSMFYLKECSLKEIEEITGYTANNIKVKVHRARQRLLKALSAMLKHEARELL